MESRGLSRRDLESYIGSRARVSEVLNRKRTLTMDMIRKLGRFVEFSVFAQPTTLDWSVIGDQKELDLLGAHLSPYCFPAVIDWIHQDRIGTDGVAGTFLPLEDWERAFSIAGTGEGGVLKVVIKP